MAVYGTCDGPERCHARFCTINGKKVICPGKYVVPIDTSKLVPDKTTDQVALDPEPVAQQGLPLQPMPQDAADAAIQAGSLPQNPYIDNGKQSLNSDSVEQNIARLGFDYSGAPTESERSIDNAFDYRLKADLEVDNGTSIFDTSNNISTLGPSPTSFGQPLSAGIDTGGRLFAPESLRETSTFSPTPSFQSGFVQASFLNPEIADLPQQEGRFSAFTSSFRLSTNIDDRRFDNPGSTGTGPVEASNVFRRVFNRPW